MAKPQATTDPAPVAEETPVAPVDETATAPEATVEETPAEEPDEPTAPAEEETPSDPEAEAPEEESAESAEEPDPTHANEPEPPEGDKDGDAVAEEQARVERETAEAEQQAAKAVTDLSREQEALLPNRGTDATGILTHTNQDVVDNFPRNENGQVEIDGNGQIVGLAADKQPSQPSGSQA